MLSANPATCRMQTMCGEAGVSFYQEMIARVLSLQRALQTQRKPRDLAAW